MLRILRVDIGSQQRRNPLCPPESVRRPARAADRSSPRPDTRSVSRGALFDGSGTNALPVLDQTFIKFPNPGEELTLQGICGQSYDRWLRSEIWTGTPSQQSLASKV